MGRAAYIRFVVGIGRDDPHWLTGAITEARILRARGELEPHECEWLDEIFAWFNLNVPCPPFSQRQWSCHAISWFKDDATDAIRTIWDLVALLRQHGLPVRVLRTDQPGMILYEDDFQVVAESRCYWYLENWLPAAAVGRVLRLVSCGDSQHKSVPCTRLSAPDRIEVIVGGTTWAQMGRHGEKQR